MTPWSELTPAQRVARIQARMRRKRVSKEQERIRLAEKVKEMADENLAWSACNARVERLRRRREVLESERHMWIRLIERHRGVMARISADAGCAHETAERAIWDLGLWPYLAGWRRHGSNA